jgi:hypothetical protein
VRGHTNLAGNRVRESTTRAGVVYQDNHLAYDTLGRLRWVADSRAMVEMWYDQAGNRTRIKTSVINGDTAYNADRHFRYDAMNRLTGVARDGTTIDTRLYDQASRVVQSGSIHHNLVKKP